MDEELEERIRRKAHEIWESEGRPHGRAEMHWDQAKEIIAIEDVGEPVIPLQETAETPVEPKQAFENQGEFPDLADQGEGSPAPELRVPRPVRASAGGRR